MLTLTYLPDDIRHLPTLELTHNFTQPFRTNTVTYLPFTHLPSDSTHLCYTYTYLNTLILDTLTISSHITHLPTHLPNSAITSLTLYLPTCKHNTYLTLHEPSLTINKYIWKGIRTILTCSLPGRTYLLTYLI